MKKFTRNEIPMAILSVIAVVGLISIALVMPGVLKLLKLRMIKRGYFNRRVQKLVDLGLLTYSLQGGIKKLQLTSKGERFLLTYKNNKEGRKPRWDKRWRIVMFDVWEKNRKKRDMLRQEIKNYGFMQLQQSIWIYPYPCDEFITLLKTDLRFGKNMRYITAHLDDDLDIRKKFNLR